MNGCEVRTLTSADLSAAHQLSRQAGWNQTPRDWLRTIRYEPDGCFVAVRSGRVVGTVTTTRYGRRLAWIGMMLVHPQHRRQGIARLLMQRAVDFLTDCSVSCIRLDATPAGEPLYRQLGFETEWTFHRWQGSAADPTSAAEAAADETATEATAAQQPAERSHSASHVTDPDATAPAAKTFAAAAFDVAAFGADRSRWLSAVAQDSLVVQHADAFGMLRPGEKAWYLGPVAARSDAAATTVISRLLQQASGPVFWDIPAENEHSLLVATALSFAPGRELTRMRLGSCDGPPDLSMQYAVCDPGMG